jgi:hypothetical protein
MTSFLTVLGLLRGAGVLRVAITFSRSQAYRVPNWALLLESIMPFDAYDPDKWIEQLRQCKHLPEPDMKILCDRVRNILLEESNIQPVSSPVTICGDIHGQFWDLLELLRKGGDVPQTSYIFMARMLSSGHGI